MIDLDTVDRALLEQLQAEFPLVPQPYAALGERLNLEEDDVLARVARLKREGIIRQIGAIFDTRRLGYQSTLAAFAVVDGRLDEVAARINAHPGVSHNYARPHHYNLWFTLAVPPARQVVDEIERLAGQTSVEDWLNLPALRVFKIRTHFQLDGAAGAPAAPAAPATVPRPGIRPLKTCDIDVIRAIQGDLPLLSHPFSKAAEQLGLSEVALLEYACRLQAAGILRRFGAVLRHRRAGYTANGMACWVVPESQTEAVGQFAAQLAQVSHCYQRPAYPPRWPYTLFTMIHGRTEEEVEDVVAQIARQARLEQYEVLYSTREFKKERIRYFEEEL
jgi:DNA-binding Lrp family transcriptional regulator